MSIFKRKKRLAPSSITDNEMFVRLIEVAREDTGIRDRLLDVLRLESSKRDHTLSVLTSAMRLRGEPDDLVESLRYLRDDEVAKKTLELLKDAWGEEIEGKI
jgi:hypothetical protein